MIKIDNNKYVIRPISLIQNFNTKVTTNTHQYEKYLV